MDIQKLADVQGLDLEDFLEIADLLVTTTRDDIRKIRDALAAGDAGAAGSAAHSIKGAAGNMGFMNLSDAAKAIEMQARSNDMGSIAAELEGLAAMLENIATNLGQGQA